MPLLMILFFLCYVILEIGCQSSRLREHGNVRASMSSRWSHAGVHRKIVHYWLVSIDIIYFIDWFCFYITLFIVMGFYVYCLIIIVKCVIWSLYNVVYYIYIVRRCGNIYHRTFLYRWIHRVFFKIIFIIVIILASYRCVQVGTHEWFYF